MHFVRSHLNLHLRAEKVSFTLLQVRDVIDGAFRPDFHPRPVGKVRFIQHLELVAVQVENTLVLEGEERLDEVDVVVLRYSVLFHDSVKDLGGLAMLADESVEVGGIIV